MKQERNKKLAKDALIYGVGNAGSRFMAFLIIPVVSFFIIPEEIGYYDIWLTRIFFLLPIVTLQMRDAVFRLLVDNDDANYRKSVISTVFFIESIVFGVVLAIALTIPIFAEYRSYTLIVLSIYVYSFYEIYQYAARVLYSPTQFVVMGVITSSLTVVFTFFLLFVFGMGIEALFIGNIASRLISIVAIEAPRRKFLNNLSLKHISSSRIVEILKYALPLMLSAIVFGSITTVGKHVIEYFYGNESNGVIALAEKYVSVVYIVGLSFYQAWQETAVRNFNSENSPAFFSSVFNKYAMLLGLLVVCIAFGVRVVAPLIIPDGYSEALGILFIYGAAFMFYCLSNFIEITFQCTKQTFKLFYPILICSLISPFLFYALVKPYGLMGYAVALCISYFYLFVYRYFQVKKTLPISLGRDFYISILLIAAAGTAYAADNRAIDFAALLSAGVLLLWVANKLRRKS